MRRELVGLALVLAAGCGVRESRDVTVLERQQVWLAERPLPPLVDARADQNGVLLRVMPNPGCVALVQDQARVRVHTTRDASRAAPITGLTLVAVGFLGLAASRDDSAPLAPSPVTAVPLMLAGTIVFLASPSGSEESHEARQAEPPQETLARCRSGMRSIGNVGLWMPDGTLLWAAASPTGVWHVEIPESTWTKHGDRFEADVIVDGAAVRRVRLQRRTE